MDIVQFKDWLRQQLDARGLSAYEFHQKARISKAAVYFYLKGQRLPEPDAVARMAEALEVPIDQVPQFERKLPGRPKSQPTS